MSQIALPLDWPASEGDGDFLVSAANQAAVRFLSAPAAWPVQAAVLTGPRKSGRSLYGRILVARTGGRLIDGLATTTDEALFHAWNEAQARRRPLLIIADAPHHQWPVELPDLKSRLAATPHVAFGDPDLDLTQRLAQRLLERRGHAAAASVAHYLAPRLDRHYHAIIAAIDALDSSALAQRRPVTVPLARALLADAAQGD